jgi:putative glutathione S-transferase
MWVFDPCPKDEDAGDSSHALSPTLDRAHSQRRLIDVYKLRNGGYDGRATVPMLWDSARREVVSNESADIIEILNASFDRFALNPRLDLAPLHLRSEIEKWNSIIYANVNNGVYR